MNSSLAPSLKLSFLIVLGGVMVVSLAEAQTQSCNVTSLPVPSPSFDIFNFTAEPWHLQKIIVRNGEELVKEPTQRCYRLIGSYTGSVEDYYTVNDQWTNLETGQSETHFGMIDFIGTDAVWLVYRFQTFYTGVWTHTDNENYAVQVYCPEDKPHHPASMLIFTRDPTPDPLLLRLLDAVAEGEGYSPKEHGIKINNADCVWPEN